MAKKTVEVDGIPYTIPENKTQQDLELRLETMWMALALSTIRS
jgi:hypothetical protein